MKNSFSSFTSLYKKYTEGVPRIYRKKGIRPGTDWKIVVITFACFVVFAIGTHVFIYIGVKDSSWWTVEEAASVYQTKINRDLLNGTLDRFEEQGEQLQVLDTTTSSVNDPSR